MNEFFQFDGRAFILAAGMLLGMEFASPAANAREEAPLAPEIALDGDP